MTVNLSQDTARCGAKLRKKAATCRSTYLYRNGRCKNHGGPSPQGLASPNLKSGRHSRYLPLGMMSAYREALGDPDLLVQREEIALLDARIAELLTALRDETPSGDWTAVRSEWLKLRAAQQRGDVDRVREIIPNLEKLILEGQQGAERWQEVYQAIRDRRRLVESERRRLVESQQVITLERAGVLMEAMSVAVLRHVSDRAVLQAINVEWNEILDADRGR